MGALDAPYYCMNRRPQKIPYFFLKYYRQNHTPRIVEDGGHFVKA
jgi:hypothetical protein